MYGSQSRYDDEVRCIHCARAFLKIEASPSKGSFSFDEKGAVACNLDCAKVAYCGGQLTKLLSSYAGADGSMKQFLMGSGLVLFQAIQKMKSMDLKRNA